MITFTLNTTGTATFYIEGNSILTNTVAGSNSSAAITLVNNKYYVGSIQYVKAASPILKLYWSYTGQTEIPVPTSAFYCPSYVASSPYQVSVVCPTFYKVDSTVSPPTCIINCGDGFRYGTESCDDGNNISGDGCSKTCTNEFNWICNGGSTTAKDVCSECKYGYQTNASYSVCELKPISDYAKWLATCTWIMICIGIVFEILNSVLTKSPPYCIYSTLENVQILMLIPATGMFFTDDLYGFFRLMKYGLLKYDFLNVHNMIFRNYTYSQDSTILYMIGFESGSTIVNSINFLFGFGVILVLQLVCFRLFGAMEDKNIKYTRFYDYLKVIYPWFFLSAYIRYMFLGTTLIFIAGIDELSTNPSNDNKWSWGIAFTLLTIYAIVGIFAIIYWILIKVNEKLQESTYFKEFIIGMKPNMVARFYIPVFLLHRFLLVLMLIQATSMSISSVLITVISIQGAFFLMLVIIRPFKNIRHNLSKIGCEAAILVLFVLLYNYRNSGWSSIIEIVFFALMMFSSMLPSAVAIGAFCLNLFVCLVSPEDMNIERMDNRFHNRAKDSSQQDPSLIKNLFKFNRISSKVQAVPDNSQVMDNSMLDKEEVKQNFAKAYNFSKRIEEQKESSINMDRNNEIFDETKNVSFKPEVDPKMFPGLIKF